MKGNGVKIRLNGPWFKQKCSELGAAFCMTKIPTLILVELSTLRIGWNNLLTYLLHGAESFLTS